MAPTTLPALLRRMGRGLLVTEQLGQGVNPVTGDFSRGVAGFWVENGVIAYPVEEITIAGNLRDMFRDIVAVGSDVDRRGSRHTGLDPRRPHDGGRPLTVRTPIVRATPQ